MCYNCKRNHTVTLKRTLFHQSRTHFRCPREKSTTFLAITSADHGDQQEMFPCVSLLQSGCYGLLLFMRTTDNRWMPNSQSPSWGALSIMRRDEINKSWVAITGNYETSRVSLFVYFGINVKASWFGTNLVPLTSGREERASGPFGWTKIDR